MRANLRSVRSFTRREGRMTHGQRRALQGLWAHYGVDAQEKLLDLDLLFGRHAPCMLEIGVGMGDAMIAMASAHPENNYLGIEVYRPGVGSLLMKVEELGLSNVRVICEDAIVVLEKMIPDKALDAVYIFFPDPWHKKRHHKRRIVQASFVALLARKIITGGVLHMATDWEDYALHMLEVMSQSPHFTNCAGTDNFSPRPDIRPLTKFEQRGQRLGHQLWDLIYKRNEQ